MLVSNSQSMFVLEITKVHANCIIYVCRYCVAVCKIATKDMFSLYSYYKVWNKLFFNAS